MRDADENGLTNLELMVMVNVCILIRSKTRLPCDPYSQFLPSLILWR